MSSWTVVVAWLVSLAVLVFERDLGTSLLFFGLFVTMLYIATQRRSWLILGSVLFIAGAVLSYYAFGHVRLRVMVWLDPWTYADDQGYQIVQSLFGLANGGILGAGLGQGFGAATAQPLGRRTYQCPLSADPQIHCLTLLS